MADDRTFTHAMEFERIYLVGFMCSGKTTVGRLLASRLNRPWVDLDELITRRTGLSPKEAFAAKGEAWFRSMESEALSEVAKGGPAIVSTGGGVVSIPQNIKAMRDSGVVVHLDISPADVLARAGDTGTRPLLDCPNPFDAVLGLMSSRLPSYEAARDAVCGTANKAAEEVCNDVVAALMALGMGEGGV